MEINLVISLYNSMQLISLQVPRIWGSCSAKIANWQPARLQKRTCPLSIDKTQIDELHNLNTKLG